MKRVEDWRFGSLWARGHGRDEVKALLSEWPVDRPRDWVRRVNETLTAKEREAIQARSNGGGQDES